RVIIAGSLFLLCSRHRTKPGFSLRLGPSLANVAQRKKVLHEILRAFGAGQQIQCFWNSAGRIEINEERAEMMVQMPVVGWVNRIKSFACPWQESVRGLAQPAEGKLINTQCL